MTTITRIPLDAKAWKLPAAAIDAYLALLAAVTDREPPCAAEPSRWYSTDPGDVAAAVEGCRRCHALDPCGSYADAAGESFGVWAGVNREPARTGTRRGAAA